MIRMEDKYRKSGIDTIGDIPWGTHICQLYHTKDDLTETLVPYFKAGLENNELCMWVTSEPLGVEDAKESLGKTVRDLSDYISKGQIEILDYSEWYTKWGKFNAEEVSHSWVEKEMKALEKGFGGLRLAGNTFWLGAKDWVDLREYEAIMDSIVIGEHRVIAICTYPLDKCKASEVLDVMNNHETTLTKQKGLWRTVESDERKRLKKVLSASETRYRRLFETAQDGIIILDADTENIIDINPFLVDMLGYSHEEFLGKKLWEIGTFRDIELSKTAFQELQRKGYVRYEDLPLQTRDGKQISVEFVSNIYEVDDKRVIQCNIRNITDRKQAEEALEKSRNELEIKVRERTAELAELNRTLVLEVEERKRTEKSLRDNERKYRTLVQNIPQAIFVKDRNSVYISCNDNYARDLKIESEEIVGKTDDEFYPRELAEKYRADDRRVIESGKPERIEERYVAGGEEMFVETFKTPVKNEKGEAIGVLGVFQDITERKQAEEALKQSLDRLQRTIEGTIEAIALIAETRDPYTAGHQRRVAKLASAIAKELGLSKEQIETILVAGTLHDIGKICVPAELLSKPGRLADVETKLIQAHSQVGCDILKTIELPWSICPAVLQHHERMDGSGYPSGISGKDITLEACILGVADVVEAMSSHRPYRPTLGIDKALEEISGNRGRLYDAKVVDACLRLFTEKGFKFDE